MEDAAVRATPDRLALVQEQFVERMWRCLLLYIVIVIPLVWIRSAMLGGGLRAVLPQTVMGFLGLLCCLLRHRVPMPLRRALPPAVLIVGGLSGVFATGMQGTGYGTVIFGCVCVATLYPMRIGVAVVVSSIVCFGSIGAAYVMEVLPLAFGLESARSPLNWIATVVHVSILSYYLLGAAADYQFTMRTLLLQRQRQRDEIATLANHDALTGLPSLRLARDRLDVACREAQRDGRLAAVLFVDLDGFKAANDSFGHDAGDAVLKAMAARLLGAIRQADTAATNSWCC